MMLRAPAKPDRHRLLWPLQPHRISCLLAMPFLSADMMHAPGKLATAGSSTTLLIWRR